MQLLKNASAAATCTASTPYATRYSQSCSAIRVVCSSQAASLLAVAASCVG